MPHSVRHDLLQAIRAFTGAQYDVLGELGADARGDLLYLARPAADATRLVALRVESPKQAVRDGRTVSVGIEQELDALVSAVARCGRCAVPTDGGPLCRSCETQPLSGELVRAAPATPVEAAELLAAYRLESWSPVGEPRRTADGTPYVFVRDAESERVLLLFLRAERPQAGVVLYRPSLAPAFAGAVPLDELPGRQTTAMPSLGAASPAPSSAADGRRKSCPQCGAEYAGDTMFCPRDGSALRFSAAQQTLVGTVIADRYQVLDVLGEGGMGKVYLAEHVKIRRRCAIKVMSQALSQDADAVGRFVREAENAARVSHPNVAAVYDFGETPDGLAYLAMELVEGESLSRVLARDGTLAPPRAAELARQVASGLAAAHELGIVHRDLKPDNVMVARARDGREVVKVVDFGIAKAGARQTQQITRTGMVLGTPEYMSPEQLMGESLDGRTDVYSLGCILYRLLTGRAPWASKSGELALGPRLSSPPPRPSEAMPGLPAGYDEVVTCAMATDPADRFQSAGELAEALAMLAGGASATGSAPATGVATRPGAAAAAATTAPVPTAERPAVRRPMPAWAMAAGVVVLLGGAAVAYVQLGGTGAGDGAAPAASLASGDSTSVTPADGDSASRAPANGAAPDAATAEAPPTGVRTTAASGASTTPAPRLASAPELSPRPGAAISGGATEPAATPYRGGAVRADDPATPPTPPTSGAMTPVTSSESGAGAAPSSAPAAVDDAAARLAAARAAAPGVVQRYELAISGRSLALLRDVYPQVTRDQQQDWRGFFDDPRNVKELKAELRVVSVSGEREPFAIELAGTLGFRDTRNAEQRVSYRARGRLVQAGGTWVLEGVVDEFGR